MKHKFYKTICSALCAVAVLSNTAVLAQNYHIPSNVTPGQRIVVGGADFTDASTVSVKNLITGSETEVGGIIGDNSISFQIPETVGEGIWSVTAGNKQFNVNMPEIRWINSDEGANVATPGGKIYINGRNLASDGKTPEVRIFSVSGERTVNAAEVVGSGCITAVIPDDTALGLCTISVGTDGVWSDPFEITVKSATEWSTTVFDVTDFGATADDETDDTYAVKLALAAAEENGGGIVLFPRGKFICGNYLKIPQYVKLKGAGIEKTQICFVTTYFDKGELPDAFLYGNGNFAIEDINFWSMRSRGFLYTSEDCKGNIFLRNVKVLYTKYIGPIEVQPMVYEFMSGGNSMNPGDDFYTDVEGDFGVRGMILYGDNIHLENSLFMFSCDTVKIQNSNGSVVRGNTFKTCNHRGVASEVLNSTSKTVWCENSDCGRLRVIADEKSCTDMYVGKNTFVVNAYGNREILTLENAETTYNGGLSEVNDGYIVLSEKPDTDITGKYITVTKGTGVGQIRKIINYDKNSGKAVLETPFAIQPNTDSEITVGNVLANQMYEGNNFTACGAVKVCGTTNNISFVENNFEYAKGIEINSNSGETAFGTDINGNVFSACLYAATADKLDEGDNMYGGIAFNTAGKSFWNNTANNKIADSGRIVANVDGRLADSVFSKNEINRADVGISLKGAAENFDGSLLSGNILNDVTIPYKTNGTVNANNLKID